MRIAYIGDGRAVHNRFMVEWFVKQGHEVMFLTDSPPDSFPCAVEQVAPSSGGGAMRHWKASGKVKKILRQWKPDILHAHIITGYGYWGAMSGFHPFVATAWGSDLMIEVHKNALVRKMVQYTLNRADLITADAKALCETADEYAKPGADIRILQWGVELGEFDAPLDETLRARFRKDADYLFISNRRLLPILNIDVIVRAFARALPQMRGSRLLVVGEGSELEALKRLADMVCVSDFIDFAGRLPRREFAAALRSADCFVSVPSSDSTPLSLLEAFAARQPVIVSDLPAMYEWVQQGENGLIVRANHEAQLTQAMIRMNHYPDTGRQWGELNRSTVGERGERNREMKKLLGWYQELIDKRRH